MKLVLIRRNRYVATLQVKQLSFQSNMVNIRLGLGANIGYSLPVANCLRITYLLTLFDVSETLFKTNLELDMKRFNFNFFPVLFSFSFFRFEIKLFDCLFLGLSSNMTVPLYYKYC